ncbi:MESP2 protein, partial [Amia calva]|nr:MESP2 protein [Amia calva]
MDFSPSYQPCGSTVGSHSAFLRGVQPSKSPSSCEEGLVSMQQLRKSRSKNPSKQRQSASEKEKMRMRDLTKALHHLRTYLPPSVAPAGQTLTKIETLRLTIRYISNLSAQLGLSEEALSQRRELDIFRCHTSPEQLGCYQYNSMPECWVQEQAPDQCQYTSAPCPVQDTRMRHFQFNTALDNSVQEDILNSSTDSSLQSPHFADTIQSCQVGVILLRYSLQV